MLEAKVGLLDLHPGPDLPIQKCAFGFPQWCGSKGLKELGLRREAPNVERRDQSGSLCAGLSLLLCCTPTLRLFGGEMRRGHEGSPVAQAGLELDRSTVKDDLGLLILRSSSSECWDYRCGSAVPGLTCGTRDRIHGFLNTRQTLFSIELHP